MHAFGDIYIRLSATLCAKCECVLCSEARLSEGLHGDKLTGFLQRFPQFPACLQTFALKNEDCQTETLRRFNNKCRAPPILRAPEY